MVCENNMLKNFIKKFNSDQRGITALITVVVVGAAALLMAYAASWAGIVDLDTSYLAQKGESIASFADGCLDESLQRLRYDVNYTGGSLSFDGGTCIINVVSAGSDRTITVSASAGDYYQALRASVTLTSNVIVLNSWEEF